MFNGGYTVERVQNISAEELKRQQEFMEKIKNINEEFYNRTGRRKKMHITTFGCPMVWVNRI